MPSLESRYLHIAGAFAAGGWFTGIGPKGDINVPIQTVAPVHLPMVGGVSEAKDSSIAQDCSKLKFGPMDKALRSEWQGKTLYTLGAAYCLAATIPNADGQPFQSRTVADIKNLRVDSVSVKRAVLNLSSSHDPKTAPHPSIRFGPTEITGLKLGKNELTVTLDMDSYNKYSTLAEFETAFRAGKLPRSLSRTLAVDEQGGLHRNGSAYVMGSLVKKIEGQLPDGATLDPNGYVIHWPKFGRIILGEVTMGAFIRRVTLIRLKHSDEEFGSGCSGGSYYP
ncbi:MAG: hypothetical protein ABI995_10605 [Acidobacteriota bacterium]